MTTDPSGEAQPPETQPEATAPTTASTPPGSGREKIAAVRPEPGRNEARRNLALGGLVGFLALAAVMWLQSARHGWPFSLHHGYVEVHGKVERAPAPAASAQQGTEAQPRTAITLAAGRASEFGIRVEAARSEPMARTIRAVAVIVPDESRVSEVHARISGWIDQLYVNKTGQTVRSGEALAAIFSPDLLAAQNELFAVKKVPGSSGQGPLLEGARSRLRVFGMTDAQIAALEARGTPTRVVTISSPRRGVVIRRNVAVGTAIDPSTELMTVADLSKIWVLAEIPERDVPDVPNGTSAVLEFPAAGSGKQNAKVAFVYPTLTERTRTLRVRFELDNPGERLKPGMYGSATFDTKERRALTVPRDAVVDTGIEQHVFVVERPEYYVPRKVEVGIDLGDRVEIRSGLMENENVVASGVFLVDSESRLRASGGGAMAGMKMDSEGDKGQMPGMAMPPSSAATTMPGMAMPAAPSVSASSSSAQPAMTGMEMPPTVNKPSAPPASAAGRAARPPTPTTSGHAGHAEAPMSMPGMNMPAPDGAPAPHTGHGE